MDNKQMEETSGVGLAGETPEMAPDTKVASQPAGAPAEAVSSPVAEASAVSEEDTVDPAVVLLALSVGSEILQYITAGDLEGLRGFVDAVSKEINKQRNLMRLLEMESDDLERVLAKLTESSESPSEPVPQQNAPSVAEVNPADVLVSPADRMGRHEKGGSRSLWELVRGG